MAVCAARTNVRHTICGDLGCLDGENAGDNISMIVDHEIHEQQQTLEKENL